MISVELCVRCKGKGLCGFPCPIIQKINSSRPHVIKKFSGSSPPEIFIGHFNYPYVYSGILAPNFYGNTEELSSPEIWFKNKLQITDILSFRAKMIYSRFRTKIKEKNKLKEKMQEIALASKPLALNIELKNKPSKAVHLDSFVPAIGNPASLSRVQIEENPKVEKKVDYLVYDYDVKSEIAIQELYKSKIKISNIIKILSAGMLGKKKNRKLVPTRWSVTAVDSNLSKKLIEKIKTFSELNHYLVFYSEYLGNHYEILMIPGIFSFEVIEAKMPGSVWNPQGKSIFIAKDYENFFGRRDYAENVSGAYYALRFAVSEFLIKVKKQASILVLREVRPEYWAPCGVGILREIAKDALSKPADRFNTLKEALENIQLRLKLPINLFLKNSKLLEEQKKQKKLKEFFKV